MITVVGGTLPLSSELAGQTVSTFQIGKYEVTWGEWQEVRLWAVNNGYSDLQLVGSGASGSHPVQQVSWYDVVKWCNAKSEKDGVTPVYQVSGATYKTGETVPTENITANGYRLPKDKEWEWAARGGVSSQGYTYSGSNDANAVAWTWENSGQAAHEIGTKAANELGIYDMSGNASEWCEDWDSWDSSDPDRLYRGGSWLSVAYNAEVASRDSFTNPATRDFRGIGFRLARSSGQ